MCQTRTIEMPSDSQFAVAMKNQQEAERAEQQRIKNLVLNYDLQGSNAEQTGTDNDLYFDYFSNPNPNVPYGFMIAHKGSSKGLGAERHQHNPSLHLSSQSNANAKPADKPSSNRSGQRARKLQLKDVDWYDRGSHSSSSSPRGQDHERPGNQIAL